MKVIVAGATGVLGQEAVAALHAAGHDVVGITRDDRGLANIAGRGATGVIADVFSVDQLTKVFQGADAVVNTLTHVPTSLTMLKPNSWKADDRLHLQASQAITAAAAQAGVKRLIQESMTFMYPDLGAGWITEDTAITPNLSVHRPRLASLRNAIEFSRSGRSSVVLRLGQLYGRDGLSTMCLRWTRDGKPCMLGQPGGYISLLHHSDAGQAFVAALRAQTGVYNVAGEPILRSRWAADVGIESGAAKPAKFIPQVAQLALGARIEPLRRSHRISSKRFRDETGWTPRIGPSTRGWSR